MLKIEDEEIPSKSAIIWSKDRYLTKSARRFIDMFEMDTAQIKYNHTQGIRSPLGAA